MLNKIPILTYHSISSDRSLVSINSDAFEKQIIFLKNRGYETINFDQLNVAKSKSIIITFDDGYKDNLLTALPILKKYGFKATCFVISNFIGKTNIWDNKKPNYIKKELMTSLDINEWVKNGMLIGSHSHNHNNLTKLDDNDLMLELAYSKELLENIISKKISYFSYPYGKINKFVCNKVKKLYSHAVTTNRSRFIPSRHQNHILPRIDMGNKYSYLKIFLKLETFYEDIKFVDNEL